MSKENKKAKKPLTAEQKKKRKKRLAVLIPIIVLVLAVIFTVGGFVIHKLSLIDYDKDESTTIDPNQEFSDVETPVDFGEIDDATGNDYKAILKNWATNEGAKMSNKNVINILLIGSDASSEDSHRASITDKGNTDAMILVSIDKVNKKLKMVSFMRDSYTYMAGFDIYRKLNAACANGGPAYLVETIENDYKIEINGYALVDFDSFREVIDVLGGVNVDVPQYVANYLNKGVDYNGKIPVPAGNGVLLNGEQALAFSRIRYSDADGDVSRVARQRQVINALIGKCKNASLSEINSVADVILANIRTNVSQKAILSYAAQAVTDGWANYEMTEITMPTPDARYGYSGSAWIWVIDYPLAAQKLQQELYGETNIKLEENRKTAISVMGGYVTKAN